MVTHRTSIVIGGAEEARTPDTPTPQQLPLPSGTELRDAALSLLERTRAEYIARARRAAIYALEERGEVCADDLHEMCAIPKSIDPRVMGAVLNRRRFRFLRYQQSRRRANHGRVIAVWGAK